MVVKILKRKKSYMYTNTLVSSIHFLDLWHSHWNPFVIGLGIGILYCNDTIIGLLLIPVLLGAFTLFYNMTLMEYLETKKRHLG